MTEQEWLACEDPRAMLTFVRGGDRNRLPERRSRLFGVACCRRISRFLVDVRSSTALDVAERYADGSATADELDAAYEGAFDVEAYYAEHPDRKRSAQLEVLGRAANAAAETCHPDELAEGVVGEALLAVKAAGLSSEMATFTSFLRDIFGNPFRPVAFDPAWRAGTAVTLARQMYASREFGAMPILADALQDAGCDNTDILTHCRDASCVLGGPPAGSPKPPPATHVRGCWVVDLVLGKE